jgi:hypothetical protein
LDFDGRALGGWGRAPGLLTGGNRRNKSATDQEEEEGSAGGSAKAILIHRAKVHAF